MTKLSDKEKRILTYIITNCEIYHFNEDESLKYIKDNLRPISRRTYYAYKNKIYKKHEANSLSFRILRMQGTKKSKNWTSLSLLFNRDDMIKEGLKNNIGLDEFNKTHDHELFLQKLNQRKGIFVDNSMNFLGKLESKRLLSEENYQSIPDKATIREEYVKCGKEYCYRCKHGPYYYAYWKDENGKLKKKYIGRNNPRKEDNPKNKFNNDLETLLSNRQNNLEDIFSHGNDNDLETIFNNQKNNNLEDMFER